MQTIAHRALSYDTSRWERLLFEKRARSGILAGAVDATATATRTSAWKYRAQHAAPGTDASRETARDFAGEVFARTYGDPAPTLSPAGPPWVGKAHEAIGALPEFGALREAVRGDPDLAALAAAEVLHAVAPKLADLARASERGPVASTSGEAAAVRAALRAGIGRATQRTGDAREALEGLAPGLGSVPATHEQANPERLALAERLLRDPNLRTVLQRAGRISRLARDRNTTRDLLAREEVVDTERGADLARILPAGLVRLRHPLLRKLALRELVERQALQYRLEGRETLGRGPIVVLLDRSSSMRGSPELWASATAIALLGAGARERRAVTVVEFDGGIQAAARFAGGSGERLATDDPGRVLATGLPLRTLALELAGRESSGGTRFEPAIRYGLRCGALDDRADLVIVTDGLADADAEILASLAEAKGRGLRVYGLLVNGGSMSPAMAAVCNTMVDLDKADDVGMAIASALPV